MSSANSTADRAIEILLLFDQDHPVLTAAAVAEHFKMPRSTTYRYLNSLRSQGLLTEADDGGFRLGHRIFSLARIARRNFSILDVAEPQLRALQAQTGETILLTQKVGQEVVILECLESSHPMRISYDRGHIIPTPAGASAKVFLAYDDPETTKKVLSRKTELPRYTANTIVDSTILKKEIEEVRKRGYALNYNEVDDGISGVAAPIEEKGGLVRYAVCVVAPSSRLTEKRIKTIVGEIRAAATTISEQMQLIAL